jgi:cytoskeletal protein CcmA (bactofilin family)
MFGMRRPPDPEEVETLIGAGTRVEGDLQVSAGVHLEGHVRGNVLADTAGKASLFVAERAVVEGVVDVPKVIVHGEVRGDIRAVVKVELGPKARVAGNVHYGLIEMASGALIQGRLVALPQPQPAAAPATPPPGGGTAT